jgi:methylmalonyl-CoA/ethylmalonyl-CoA epimerase
MIGRRFMQYVDEEVLGAGEFSKLLDRIAAREVDPYMATESVMSRALGGPGRVASPLDHVGIAVRDASSFAMVFRTLAGLETGEPEVIGPHRLRFVDAGGATLELVEALTPDSPIGRFLDKRGEALHHLCFRVADIEKAIAGLKERGIRFIDESPRPGAHGSKIAFIHPSSAGGLLIELKEAASGHEGNA